MGLPYQSQHMLQNIHNNVIQQLRVLSHVDHVVLSMQVCKPSSETAEAVFTAAVVNELSAELQQVLQVHTSQQQWCCHLPYLQVGTCALQQWPLLNFLPCESVCTDMFMESSFEHVIVHCGVIDMSYI